jgi:hypothetical protein
VRVSEGSRLREREREREREGERKREREREGERKRERGRESESGCMDDGERVVLASRREFVLGVR